MSTYAITINGTQYVVEVGDASTSPVQVIVNGEPKTVEFKAVEVVAPAPAAAPAAPAPRPEAPKPEPAPAPKAPVAAGVGKQVVAPMPGKILSIRVKAGDKVAEGDTVCTLEAMKMEMPISTTFTGTVQAVHTGVGDNVAYNDPLLTIA